MSGHKFAVVTPEKNYHDDQCEIMCGMVKLEISGSKPEKHHMKVGETVVPKKIRLSLFFLQRLAELQSCLLKHVIDV